jgi:hypothetical protein
MSKKRIASIAFWIIIGINLLYLNGFYAAVTKSSAFFSPLILASCIVIIFTTPKPKLYFNTFKILVLFFILYFVLGGVVIYIWPERLHTKTSMYELYRGYISSVLIFWALFQYLVDQYISFGKQRILNILHSCSYLVIIPIIFTIFGEQLGLTETMTFAKDFSERQIGIFTNPNTTGLHANFVLCFSLYSLIANRKGKLLWIILIPAACYGAFLSLSKAAMLMASLNMTFFILYSMFSIHRQNLKSKAVTFGIVTLLSCGFYYLYSNFTTISRGLTIEQLGRVSDALELSKGNINERTTSERSGLFEFVAPILEKHYAFGYGIGTFHRLKGRGLGVHNTAIVILGEGGVIVAFAYVLFIISFVRDCLKNSSVSIKYLGISIFLTYFFIAFLTSHNALDERLSNVLLGLMLVVIKCK